MRVAPGPDLGRRPCCGLNWRLLRIASLCLLPTPPQMFFFFFFKCALDSLFPELGLSSSSQING